MENRPCCTLDARRNRPRRSLMFRLAAFVVVLVVVSLIFTGEHWLLLEAPASAAAVPALPYAANSG